MATDLTAHADALQAILTDKGLLQTSDLEDFRHKVIEEWLPRNGARLCARAWVDPAFKAELLKDGRAAAASMGFPMPDHHRSLVVLENTAELQNVICCTLCSCTAFTIIGMSPGWYKDLEYRARIVREARSVLRDMVSHWPNRSAYACGTPPPTPATWCCPIGRRTRKVGAWKPCRP